MAVASLNTLLGKDSPERKAIFLALFGALLAVTLFPHSGFAWEWPWESADPNATSGVDAAVAQAGHIVKEIVENFKKESAHWIGQLKSFAERLLYLFAVLECALIGIRLALGHETIGDAVKQLVMFILMVGFFLAVIHNYDTWSNNIIEGLTGSGGISAALGAPVTSIEAPFEVGVKLTTQIWNSLSIFSPGSSAGLIIVGLVVLVCFVCITARMILIKCEAYVAMAAALLLVGFGGSSMTKEYAINALRYILSVAMKLFVMQLVMTIGINLISKVSLSPDPNITELTITTGVAVVLLALVATLPGIVAGIMNGSHIGSGAGLGAAARGIGSAGAALGGAVVGAGASVVAGAMSSPIGAAAGAGKGIFQLAGGGKRAVGHISRGADGGGGGGSAKPQGSSIMKERLAAATQPPATPRPPKPKG